ncbi:response regulator [Nitrospina sp. 32_T5]|uniref:response regulator n=1 Tax=unclassified Nitrospina TaxID=2638683 RepID=UPI003F9BE44D
MKLKILVADDSISIQKLVAMAFYNEDMEVEGISDGVKAFNYLSDYKPDLVMADIYLPGMNGFELSKKIKNSDEFQNIHVLLLTSDFEELDEIMYADSEADGHISKPFKTDEIIRTVKRLLDGSAAPQPSGVEEDEEYEIEGFDPDSEVEVEVVDAGDEIEVEAVDEENEGDGPKWIELSPEDLVPPDTSQKEEPQSETAVDAVSESDESGDSMPPAVPDRRQRQAAFQESLDELDRFFHQLTESTASQAPAEEEDAAETRIESPHHPDLIQEALAMMGEESPSSNGGNTSNATKVAPVPVPGLNGDPLQEVVHQHIRSTLRTEMAGLSGTIRETVRQVVEEVAPDIIREVIQEEIARLKKSETL